MEEGEQEQQLLLLPMLCSASGFHTCLHSIDCHYKHAHTGAKGSIGDTQTETERQRERGGRGVGREDILRANILLAKIS